MTSPDKSIEDRLVEIELNIELLDTCADFLQNSGINNAVSKRQSVRLKPNTDGTQPIFAGAKPGLSQFDNFDENGELTYIRNEKGENEIQVKPGMNKADYDENRFSAKTLADFYHIPQSKNLSTRERLILESVCFESINKVIFEPKFQAYSLPPEDPDKGEAFLKRFAELQSGMRKFFGSVVAEYNGDTGLKQGFVASPGFMKNLMERKNKLLDDKNELLAEKELSADKTRLKIDSHIEKLKECLLTEVNDKKLELFNSFVQELSESVNTPQDQTFFPNKRKNALLTMAQMFKKFRNEKNFDEDVFIRNLKMLINTCRKTVFTNSNLADEIEKTFATELARNTAEPKVATVGKK